MNPRATDISTRNAVEPRKESPWTAGDREARDQAGSVGACASTGGAEPPSRERATIVGATRPRLMRGRQPVSDRGCARMRRGVGGLLGFIRGELLGAGMRPPALDRAASHDEKPYSCRSRGCSPSIRRGPYCVALPCPLSDRRCHLGTGPAGQADTLLHQIVRASTGEAACAADRLFQALPPLRSLHPRGSPAGKIRKIKYLERNRGTEDYRG